jgi:hypothetical protein
MNPPEELLTIAWLPAAYGHSSLPSNFMLQLREEVRFAPDSLLEGTGLEPLVRPDRCRRHINPPHSNPERSSALRWVLRQRRGADQTAASLRGNAEPDRFWLFTRRDESTARRSRLVKLGYKLMAKEHGPAALVRNTVRAEQAGFASRRFSTISSLDEQGHAPFAWSVLAKPTRRHINRPPPTRQPRFAQPQD